MAREKGLYRRKDSPYWWVDVVLPDGRRVCKSTRLKVLEDAEEYLIRLKAEAYEAARTGIPAEHNWQDAVVQYLEDSVDKRSLDDDKANLLKLDPYLRGLRLRDLNMSALRPFVLDRKQKDGVANSTINRALEIVRRILYLARDDWGWITRVPKIRMLKEPKRRVRFLKEEEADRLVLALPEHLVPVVRFALATGCRMTETLRLEWNRVDFPKPGRDPGAEKRSGAARTVVLYVPGKAHGGDWLCMETLVEACRDRELSVPRLAPYLGELARNERNQSARADGVRWLEVVRDGVAVCTFGTGAFIECGGTN